MRSPRAPNPATHGGTPPTDAAPAAAQRAAGGGTAGQCRGVPLARPFGAIVRGEASVQSDLRALIRSARGRARLLRSPMWVGRPRRPAAMRTVRMRTTFNVRPPPIVRERRAIKPVPQRRSKRGGRLAFVWRSWSLRLPALRAPLVPTQLGADAPIGPHTSLPCQSPAGVTALELYGPAQWVSLQLVARTSGLGREACHRLARCSGEGPLPAEPDGARG